MEARAAITTGYREKSARTIAWRLLRKANISEALDEVMEKHGVTERRTTADIAQIAYSTDLADFQLLLDGSMTLEELRATGVDTPLI